MKIRKVSRREFLSLTATGVVVACGSSDEAPPTSTGTGVGGAGGTSSSSTTTSSTGGSGGGGSGGSPPTGPGPEPADPWEPPGTEDATAFAWGVQTGDALPTAVLVSMRTLEPTVTISVAKGVESGWEDVAVMEPATVDQGMVHLELTELDPDTTYSVVFHAADGTRRSRVARFRTAIPAGQSRVVRFGISSCLGDADDPWPCLSYSHPEKLDFFLLLGDTIYADDNPDQFDFVAKYETALSLSGLNDLTAGTSVVATWDDHEVDNNWSWSDNGIQQLHADALAAFRDYIPQRQGATGTIWRKLSWGKVMDLFVLDCRSERLNGNYISPEQMDWLKQELSASTAVFKVILNSVPIFDFAGTIIGSISADDRWQGYPTQRDEILQHIRSIPLTGVLWVTGDVHFGAVGQVDQMGGPGDYLWEIIAGPAGAIINPAAFLLQENARMPSVITTFNWVLCEADPDTGTVSVQFIDRNNQVVASEQLKIA